MSEPFVFARQAAVGKLGENAVLDWLLGQGYSVCNVSDAPAWQTRDIDFLITPDEGGNELTVEVKTDTHAPINLFLELTDDGRPGYLFKTRADVLLYYFPGAQLLFWLLPSQLSWWVCEHAADLRRIEVKSKRHRGGEPWVSVGVAVPVAALREAGLVTEYRLEEEEQAA